MIFRRFFRWALQFPPPTDLVILTVSDAKGQDLQFTSTLLSGMES
jgi:hypothetical protein